MNEQAISLAVTWLVFGWLFTVWFVNRFLEDRRWADTGKEIGPGMMITLNIVGPAMAAVMLVMVTIAFILERGGDFIRRIYGVAP